MKFSEQWLREWVNPPITTQQLVEQLTMAGLEVDSFEPVAGQFTDVVVAEVLSVEQHPNADRLRLCRVNTGKEELSIVCGATNVRAGLKVPLALIGAKLPNDVHIKRSKIRGIESQGMICSATELGLGENAPGSIIELPADAPVGVDFNRYLQCDDYAIDVELTPNRGDCLSIQGMARDVAAINRLQLHSVAIPAAPTTNQEVITIDVVAKDACPRYMGRVINHIDNTKTSPIWLTERLRRSGLRAINPVVDVLNYVMLELGQPLHAFAKNKITDKINVRFAKPDETLTLLNGQHVTLQTNTLVIADLHKPLAIAGVMGGEESSVTESTTDIFIESAFFTPAFISGRARLYGLHTDASYRYERGVDPELPQIALDRATNLLLTITGGEAGPIVGKTDEANLPKVAKIKLTKAKISRYLGLAVPDQDVVNILQSLHVTMEPHEQGWYVTPPSYRFDITQEVDLIEEIARLTGYQHIPTHLQFTPLSSQLPSESTVTVDSLKASLVNRGYQEAITYSFVDAKLQELFDPEMKPLVLSNPLSPEMAVMRTNLWPGLMNAVLHNQRRQQTRVRLFEIGQRFVSRNGNIEQTYMLAGVATGSRYPEQWAENLNPIDFYDIKSDVEALLRLTGNEKDFMFESGNHPALLPGQTAKIYHAGREVGYIGLLHPRITKTLDCVGPVFLFEIELTSIIKAILPEFISPSKFPSIRRDIAIIIDRSVTAHSVLKVIKRAAAELLADAIIFDVYDGKGIPADKKSFAVGLTLQHQNRTLIDEEVNQVVGKVVGELQNEFNAILRE